MSALLDQLQAQGQLKVQGAVQGQLDSVQGQLDAAGTPEAEQAREDATASGIQAVANGKQPSEAQIEAGATTAAVAATALATGVSLAAASAALGPIGLVVFAGGAALDAGIQAGLRALGWMKSNVACSSDDPASKVSGPNDPNWRHYTTDWVPYTNGKFEVWARGQARQYLELADNCRMIPAPNWQVLARGIVNTWNAHAPPGTPMRTIKWHMAPGEQDDPTNPHYFAAGSQARENDPIQQLVRAAFTADPRNGTPSITDDVSQWQLQVADIPPTPVKPIRLQLIAKTAIPAKPKPIAKTISKPPTLIGKPANPHPLLTPTPKPIGSIAAPLAYSSVAAIAGFVVGGPLGATIGAGLGYVLGDRIYV